MSTHTVRFPIVGIGASAGGLEALERFFRATPARSGMAFVIVMHLAPSRKSALSEIIARFTAMDVEVGCDGQQVERDAIYVIPPGAILTISQGRLNVHKIEPGHHERRPIDIFFGSLAQDCGEYAAGVILSGSGSDGVLGIKAIKRACGVTLAQATDLSGPGFAGMPDSAIASGLVDFAVPIEVMPTKLIENFGGLDAQDDGGAGQDPSAENPADAEARQAVFDVLRDRAGHDFSGYKTQTFMRRIHRRMQVKQCKDLDEYVQKLRQDPDEATFLFRDLLINVTSFFRDPEAFDVLRETVIPALFEGRDASDFVRVWAPGCATGEEVFSIAMLLLEHLDQVQNPPQLTIFATDLDEEALTVARAGRYPEALMDGVSAARRERFFTFDSGSYVVSKALRDLCIFSSHSITRDPPFSRMDLVSCRNLLIYFGPELQRRLIPLFCYALRPRGFLFLGMSETIGQFSELFTPLDKKHCVFQAREADVSARLQLFSKGWLRTSLTGHHADRPSALAGSDLRRSVEARIADRFAPPHVVVNEDGDIVYFSARTGKYLEASAGAPNLHLLTMARAGLRLDLRGALNEALETSRSAKRENISIELEAGYFECASLTVEPLPERLHGQRLFLVVFKEGARAIDPVPVMARQGDGPDRPARFDGELRETRERLQTMIQEYETAIEELKSANEELISLNEEMQSGNEELESSKEEMQSLNEELHTVNIELQGKVHELDQANSDLKNEFASTGVASVFLDRNLAIRSLSPAATQIFNILPIDTGRPLTDLVTTLDYPDLTANLRAVLSTGDTIEKPTRKNEPGGPHYLARLIAYRNSTHEIDGLVAAFIDVTSLVKAEEEVRKLQADRLADMRQTAVSLAHEINQPILACATYLDSMRRLLQMPLDQRPAKIEEVLDKAAEQVTWAAQIVAHLRDFVAHDETRKRPEHVHTLIHDAYQLMNVATRNANVNMSFQLAATNDRVVADKVEILRVLINLMKNAIQAMHGSKQPEMTISTALIEPRMIRIDVADTGPGIREDIKTTLFEPLTTTKPEGLGLGLSISRSVITTHGGRISAESNPDLGTVLSFTLPLADSTGKP
jgi:two-component system CheB/CheR fusion protein